MVGLVVGLADCSDIGGTRDTISVRGIFEESIEIQPIKPCRRGEANDDLTRLIRRNIRTEEWLSAASTPTSAPTGATARPP